MSEIALDNTVPDDYLRLNITFAYDKWEEENLITSTLGAVGSVLELI